MWKRFSDVVCTQAEPWSCTGITRRSRSGRGMSYHGYWTGSNESHCTLFNHTKSIQLIVRQSIQLIVRHTRFIVHLKAFVGIPLDPCLDPVDDWGDEDLFTIFFIVWHSTQSVSELVETCGFLWNRPTGEQILVDISQGCVARFDTIEYYIPLHNWLSCNSPALVVMILLYKIDRLI